MDVLNKLVHILLCQTLSLKVISNTFLLAQVRLTLGISSVIYYLFELFCFLWLVHRLHHSNYTIVSNWWINFILESLNTRCVMCSVAHLISDCTRRIELYVTCVRYHTIVRTLSNLSLFDSYGLLRLLFNVVVLKDRLTLLQIPFCLFTADFIRHSIVATEVLAMVFGCPHCVPRGCLGIRSWSS